MLSSCKLTQSVAYLLVCSLLVAGLIRSTTLPAAASDDAAPLQLASIPAPSGAQAAPKTGTVDEATKARVSEAYNQLPMSFEENRGQLDPQVKYISRGSASTLFLTQTEAVLTLHRGESKGKQISSMSVVRMRLHGAIRSPRITGEQEMSARTNYFIGNDPQQWRGDVAQYERVRYSEVYPGIDLLYYGQQQSLEYDFEVAPGADPCRIMLGFKGVRGLKIERATGDLLLNTASGEIRQAKPVVYQEVDGERREVQGRYVIKGKRKVGFKIGAYDQTQRLVIDPVLTYSTYLGGTSGGDYGNAIAVDAAGIVYVTGNTTSYNFPILNQYQTSQGDFNGDVFVTKLNPNLSGAAMLLYSTYLGGNAHDRGNGIAVDGAGNVYVAGDTLSTNFPVLHQYQGHPPLSYDAFVTRLNTNLSGTASLVYSTYLGGSDNDFGEAIAIDSTGNAYVTGYAYSNNFPTLNQYQTYQNTLYAAFVTKLNTNLSGTAALLYSTYLGGSGYSEKGTGIAVDSSGNVYVTGGTTSPNFPVLNQYQPDQGGQDAFVAKLNPNLSGTASLLYSTYLGGSDYDIGLAIAIDSTGNVYVTGQTRSNNFPTLNQYQTYQGGTDVFVAKLNPNLSGTAALLYSTYLGGSDYDLGLAIAIDSTGNAYVTGYTYSNNFPILNQYQPDQNNNDVFVTKLNTNLSGTASLIYSTYLGGINSIEEAGNGIAVDAAGNAYVAGVTDANNFPTRNPFQTFQAGYDAFITKLTVTPPHGDFDADRKTDLALWHPSTGDWEYIRTRDAALITRHWGVSGDRPVPGYYDQDGQTDLAVFRPSEGNWYIFQSFDQSVKTIHLGASTDIPVAADYDGDGKTDAAVFRSSEGIGDIRQGIWVIRQSSNNNVVELSWGLSEDKPVPADYDRDGRADLAVFRPSDNTWYILRSWGNDLRVVQWGVGGDRPVVGDYDGDERADVAVWRPSTGTWYALRSSDDSLFAVQWGAQGDVPVQGDYDGDGQTDIAVWRPSTGTWYVLRSSDGMLLQQQFGSSGDVPVPAAYLPE